jgi:L,D-peptidoglycan transpeptidase YkuD (ErfK/YbiS/YcfS/YnhG family)
MALVIHPDGQADWRGRSLRCALGRGGIIDATDKREGDGATPAGRWHFRRALYRADRMNPPATALPLAPITPEDGWCDDASHADYNRQVTLPFATSYEHLWRDDALYDLVVVLGHNDDPPKPGLGSAIFLHVAKPDYAATEGCVALSNEDLLAVVTGCAADTVIEIRRDNTGEVKSARAGSGAARSQ